MKLDFFKITIMGYLLSAMVGCTPVASSSASNDPTPIAPASTQGDSSTMPSNLSTPANSGLEILIEKAKADLAQKLTVSVDEINLMEATAVTWPNASLGCPQEGMAYAEVLTPGYLILLEYRDNTFEYHASGRDTIVTCENPSPPVPGDPSNT